MLKIIFCNNIKGIIPCFLTFSVIIEKFDVVPIPESVCKLFFFSGTFGIFVHFVHGALKFHNNEHNIGLFNIIMVSTGIPGIFPGKFSCNIISLIPPPVYSPPSNISALSLWSYHSSYTESLIFLCPFPPPSFFFLFVFFLYFLGIFKISSSFFYLLFLVTGAVLNSLNDPLKIQCYIIFPSIQYFLVSLKVTVILLNIFSAHCSVFPSSGFLKTCLFWSWLLCQRILSNVL